MNSQVVGGIVGVVILVLAGGGYSGACYIAGDQFVQAYEAKIKEVEATGVAKIKSDISKGMFTTKIVTTVTPQGNGVEKVILTTEVDHKQTLDRAVHAVSKLTFDEQTNQKMQAFLTTPVDLTLNVTGQRDGTLTMQTNIGALESQPMLKAAGIHFKSAPISATTVTDGNLGVPNKMTVSVPSVDFAMEKDKVQLRNLSWSTTAAPHGGNVSMSNVIDLQSLKMYEGKKKKPFIAINPAKINMSLENINAAALRKANTNPGGGAMALMSSPQATVSLDKSFVKTNFGEFRLDGKLQNSAGGPKGDLDFKLPFGKKAMAFYPPEVVRGLKKMLKKGYLKRKKGHCHTKISFAGNKMKMNGKEVSPGEFMSFMGPSTTSAKPFPKPSKGLKSSKPPKPEKGYKKFKKKKAKYKK